MTEPRKNAGNTRGKPFAKGNPGKPKGARHKTTIAIEALLEGEHEALTQAAIGAAKGGDMAAMRLCLDRIAPARKDTPISFDLPKMETANDAAEGARAVLSAVAAGEVTPLEGAAVMGLIENYRRTLETTEIEARLTALEGKAA